MTHILPQGKRELRDRNHFFDIFAKREMKEYRLQEQLLEIMGGKLNPSVVGLRP